MIVTIDGPAGAGKSTAARELARRLGFEYLDTGAMYRAVTWLCLEGQLDLTDQAAVAETARGAEIDFRGGRIYANGRDVSGEIRSVRVTEESRFVAGNQLVRELLVELQRRIAGNRDIVTEGRDQGTVAFPQAECKFFLTADPRERARRRQAELQQRGEEIDLETLVTQIVERDQRDAERKIGALRPAEDAVVIDTSRLDTETIIVELVERVRRRQAAGE
jgi:cytidylate kinase